MAPLTLWIIAIQNTGIVIHQVRVSEHFPLMKFKQTLVLVLFFVWNLFFQLHCVKEQSTSSTSKLLMIYFKTCMDEIQNMWQGSSLNKFKCYSRPIFHLYRNIQLKDHRATNRMLDTRGLHWETNVTCSMCYDFAQMFRLTLNFHILSGGKICAASSRNMFVTELEQQSRSSWDNARVFLKHKHKRKLTEKSWQKNTVGRCYYVNVEYSVDSWSLDCNLIAPH